MLTRKYGVGLIALLLATLGLVPCGNHAQADEAWTQDHDARLAMLESELRTLRCQLRTQCSSDSTCQSRCDDFTAYAGAAAVFARPHFKESFQYSQINTSTGQQTLHPFSFDYDVTPRIWLGVRTNSNLGMHVDYWEYHHSSNPAIAVSDGIDRYFAHATTIIFPATIVADDAGDTLINDSSLETQILNLAGTYHTRMGSVQVRAAGGLRYMMLDQELSSLVIDGVGVPQGILNWSRRYEGLGPVAMLEARKPLGKSGLTVLAGGGGSFLFGSKKLNRLVLGDIGSPTASRFLQLDDADEVVGMGELSLGIEWAHRFCNGTTLGIQGRYEGQFLAEAGAPTLGFLGFEGFGVLVELRR